MPVATVVPTAPVGEPGLRSTSMPDHPCWNRFAGGGAVLLLLSMLVGIGVADDPEPSPSAAILAQVTAIASAGVPGPLAVFSEQAWVLAVGRNDRSSELPVAAAALWERGRVIALGHGGMIGAEALKHPGSERFVVNGMSWLSGGDATTVGVLRNDAMVEVLRAAGFDARPLRGAWPEAIEQFDALVIDAHALGDELRPVVERFVRQGGGLLTAGLGWGWLQLNAGRTIDQHPGNRLLREAGLAWCDGTLEPTERGAFTIAAPSAFSHALHALERLEAAASITPDAEATARAPGKRAPETSSDLDPQVGTTLLSVLRVLPENHPLILRANALLETRLAAAGARGRVTPSQEQPLRANAVLERTMLALELERDRRGPPESIRAHPAAAAFPGAVPADAPRIEREVTIDRTRSGWQGTGLYAAPGEVIRVTPVDGDAAGITLRIGAHTDQLWHLARWDRAPEIVRLFSMKGDGTSAASAFGGLIYLEALPAGEGSTRVRIEGAVEAPRFVLGETTPEQWRSARGAPAPWGELESSKVIITVPSGSMRSLEDPAELMRFWDRISDAHATLATIPLDPPHPHRFVADLQISAGYMHSGYPIMTHLDAAADMTSLQKLRSGSWGLLHELGHNHQHGDWTFDGTGEVTCNLFSLHAIDTICSPPEGSRGHGGVDAPPSLEQHLAKGAPFDDWKRDPFLALHMYVQLQRAFGWETFERVFAEYRSLDRAQRPRNDDEKRDQWMVRFSRACGHDLGPFFQAWGVPTSQEARTSIADLPSWMPEDWPKH